MSVLNSFRMMNMEDSSDLPKFEEITDTLTQWTPFIIKHNREESGDAKNDAFLKALDNHERKKDYLSKYIVDTAKYYKGNNKDKKADIIENLELYISDSRDFLNQKTMESLLSSEETTEEIENFIEESEFAHFLEYILISNSKDFIYLMEELITNKKITKYRSTGITRRDISEFFDNLEFIDMLSTVAYNTTGFLAILIYYYITYREDYKEVAETPIKDEYNNFIVQYTNTLCYIVEDMVHNKSSFKNTYIINREELINEIFDHLFEEENNSLSYVFEGTIFYRLLDNKFYFEALNFEEILKTQIRNIVLTINEKADTKYVGELGDYDIFVSKSDDIDAFNISLGDKNINFDLEQI